MHRERSLWLWAMFPLLALALESGMWWKRGFFIGWIGDTAVRLTVWAVLVWNAIEGDWASVFGASVAIVGLGLIPLVFHWYVGRKGWRQRWLRS